MPYKERIKVKSKSSEQTTKINFPGCFYFGINKKKLEICGAKWNVVV